MSLQYSGGTIVNSTFTGAAKQDIVSNLETMLTSAGWSVVSGSGSTDVIMQSASTPTAANYIRIRLRSTNLTNCCCVNMQNTSASLVSQNYFLLPAAAKTFRVIANKYQFFITGGTSGREFVGLGVPHTPSWLHGVITGEFGWIQGNGNSDTNATVYTSFQTLLHSTTTNLGYWSGLCAGSLLNAVTGTGMETGGMRLVIPYSAFVQSVYGYRWHDDSLHLSDPLIAWGLTSASADEAKVRGQLWGAMVVSDAFAAGTTLTSVDGHDWYAITNSNGGTTSSARGTLFVATT